MGTRKSGTYRTSYKGVTELDIKEFAANLHRAMVEKGWKQSELARQAFGNDDKGQPKGRDRISVYLAGKNLPDTANMQAIARALGKHVDELAPRLSKSPLERNAKPYEVSSEGRFMRVRIDMLCTSANGSKLLELAAQLHDEFQSMVIEGSNHSGMSALGDGALQSHNGAVKRPPAAPPAPAPAPAKRAAAQAPTRKRTAVR